MLSSRPQASSRFSWWRQNDFNSYSIITSRNSNLISVVTRALGLKIWRCQRPADRSARGVIYKFRAFGAWYTVYRSAPGIEKWSRILMHEARRDGYRNEQEIVEIIWGKQISCFSPLAVRLARNEMRGVRSHCLSCLSPVDIMAVLGPNRPMAHGDAAPIVYRRASCDIACPCLSAERAAALA